MSITDLAMQVRDVSYRNLKCPFVLVSALNHSLNFYLCVEESADLVDALINPEHSLRNLQSLFY